MQNFLGGLFTTSSLRGMSFEHPCFADGETEALSSIQNRGGGRSFIRTWPLSQSIVFSSLILADPRSGPHSPQHRVPRLYFSRLPRVHGGFTVTCFHILSCWALRLGLSHPAFSPGALRLTVTLPGPGKSSALPQPQFPYLQNKQVGLNSLEPCPPPKSGSLWLWAKGKGDLQAALARRGGVCIGGTFWLFLPSDVELGSAFGLTLSSLPSAWPDSSVILPPTPSLSPVSRPLRLGVCPSIVGIWCLPSPITHPGPGLTRDPVLTGATLPLSPIRTGGLSSPSSSRHCR